VVAASKVVADGYVVFTQKAECLRGVDVQAVVVTLSVLVITKALALELAASGIGGGKTVDVERRRSAGKVLRDIGYTIDIGSNRFVVDVVVAPSPGSVNQPAGSQRAVVADHKAAGTELQLVVHRVVGNDQERSVRSVVAIGRIAEYGRLELMVLGRFPGQVRVIGIDALGDVDVPQRRLAVAGARTSGCARAIRAVAQLGVLVMVSVPLRIE